jgi:hypothetical protein
MNQVLSVLIWALPVSFCLHVTEEFVFPGGFIKWYHQYRPLFAAVNPFHYFKVNTIGFLLILATAISTASTGKGYSGFLIASSFLSCNEIFTHISGAIKIRCYSPGMLTGAVLYIPLTILSYLTVFETGKLDIPTMALCIALSPLLEIFFLKKPAPEPTKETNKK